ncbi:MAG: biopolymer transporter ExbD [Sulfuricurvum sp. PC08-66]|nr:MAG: biopolymer transporter ExbD [Sulfuricurvum sp. PC08-66]
MKFRKKSTKVEDIDLSPLIDMVFILLIFFMVSSTFTKDMQLELNRPGASSASKSSTKVVRVYIDKFSDIYLDGQPIKVWAIQGKLRDMMRLSDEKSVLVVSDENVKADTLVEVVDQCRLAGAKDVGVATQREAG